MTEHDEHHQPEDAVEDLEVSEEEAADVEGGGKAQFQDIHFTKYSDKSTPGL
jgi:type VI protein secretion system component Hcp